MPRGAAVDALCLGVGRAVGDVVTFHLLAKGVSVNAVYIAVYQSSLSQFVHYAEYAARAATLLDAVFLGVGRQLAKARHSAAKLVDVGHGEVGAGLLRHGQQMEHCVGASAHGYVERHGIEERLPRGYVARQHALVAILVVCHGVVYNLPGGVAEQLNPVFMGGQYGAVAGQGLSDGLGERVH